MHSVLYVETLRRYIAGTIKRQVPWSVSITVPSKSRIVIDDLNTADPSDPQGIRIYGTADVVNRQGGYMAQTEHDNPVYIKIIPGKRWSWGIEEPVFWKGSSTLLHFVRRQADALLTLIIL
jgi:hypothetical protein